MQSLSCIEQITCKILKSGSIPSHIGFIMDGNRRHAKKNKFSSTHQGHVQGVRSLKKCLLFCQELGIQQISLFCFSIENFNRSEEQVNGLMELCLSTFEDMSSMSQLLLKNEIKVKIVGRKQKLRSDVLQAFNKIESRTKSFTKTTVNFCFAYDSISEIESSVKNCEQSSYQSFMYWFLDLDKIYRFLLTQISQQELLMSIDYLILCYLNQHMPIFVSSKKTGHKLDQQAFGKLYQGITMLQKAFKEAKV